MPLRLAHLSAVMLLAPLLFAPFAGCSKPAKPADRAPDAPASCNLTEGEYLAVVLSHGSMWDPAKARDDQIGMTEHRAYMRTLFERGEILFGGPFLDRPGGVAVFRTRSRDDAERLAAGDPGVKSGLIRAEVTRWRLGVASAR